MANKISDEKIEQIKELFNKGISLQGIAKQLELGNSTVERYVRKLNLKRGRKKTLLSNNVLEEIKRLYVEERVGTPTIAKILNINERTVVRQLKNMQIEIRGNKKIDTNTVIDLYTKEYMPIYKIAKKLGSSEERISKLLKSNNVEIYGHGIPQFNYHIFDSIDNEEKAYWLGMIFADGYIATINPNKVNYAFELSLKSSDYEHLNKFNSFMEFRGNNVKISTNTLRTTSSVTEGLIQYERCRWCISNKHLWETLNNYGCTPLKSFTMKFPDESIFTDKSLIRHFIRGHFDGDGCVSESDNYPIVSIASGSKDFLLGIMTYINIFPTIYPQSNIFYIQTKYKKAMQFLHYIYDESTIYLKRKYDLFKYYCEIYH